MGCPSTRPWPQQRQRLLSWDILRDAPWQGRLPWSCWGAWKGRKAAGLPWERLVAGCTLQEPAAASGGSPRSLLACARENITSLLLPAAKSGAAVPLIPVLPAGSSWDREPEPGAGEAQWGQQLSLELQRGAAGTGLCSSKLGQWNSPGWSRVVTGEWFRELWRAHLGTGAVQGLV